MRLMPSLGLVILGLAAVPANAQIVARRSYEPVPPRSLFLPDSRLPGPSIGDELRDIRSDIRRARDSGWLSRSEARRLDREARRIAHTAARYAGDGLTDDERAELRSRGEALRSAMARP